MLSAARAHWLDGRPKSAVEAAWAAFDRAPADRKSKRELVNLLHGFPSELTTDREPALLALLTDPEVDPDSLNHAGWQRVLQRHGCGGVGPDAPSEDTLAELTAALEADALALALLRESPVVSVPAQRMLMHVRRRLLLSGDSDRFPFLVEALRAQALLNGGAWPYDDEERPRLSTGDTVLAAAYVARPSEQSGADTTFTDSVTRAVAAQYEGWPYPSWRRITRGAAKRLPDTVRALDPGGSPDLPVDAQILVAGCGTGRHSAYVAASYPDATVTAIDISEASLEYARARTAALGIENVRFRRLDLYDVATLRETYDAIYCAGVLHHLPDPELGLAALTDALRLGGVMRLMVYSRLARLTVAAARTLVRDLLDRPVSDDLLREIRRRFLERSEHPLAGHVLGFKDFATLAGVYDLLMHRHEDPFDVPRIERALRAYGLRLLRFELPTPADSARYDRSFPDDKLHRDYKSWREFELGAPTMFRAMYDFWCRRD